jgi:hypothetical protein
MTRETKVGAVVAISFLSLVGVVVVSKWRNRAESPEVTEFVKPEEPSATQPKVNPAERGKNETTPASKAGPIQNAKFEGDPADVPSKLPPAFEGSPNVLLPTPSPVPSSLPAVPAPEDEKRKKLLNEIAAQQIELPQLPPLPVNEVLNNAADTNAADKLNKSLQSLDQVQVGNDAVKKAAQMANNQLEDLLKKGSEATSKGLDNLDTLPSLPASTNNPLPGLPMVVTTPSLPQLPSGPGEKPAATNPLPPAPRNPGLAPLPAPSNPVAKVEMSPAPIPAPQINFPTTPANNPNALPAIPAPRAEVRVVDAQVYTVTAGDTFATISKGVYGTEKYGKALLAYNRDYAPNRTSLTTTPQAGQTLLIPPEQLLKDNYAAAIETASAAPSLSTPVPAPIPMPRPPTSDPTKLYRVPAQGQFLFEIAIRTMGDGNRWTEIYRLNPNINPQQPIPGGTELRLPAMARVQ